MGISGSALAMETGHVILMSNNIQKIPLAIKLARRTLRKLIENVIISITTKGAILALAFADTPKLQGGHSRSRFGTFSMPSLYGKGKSINPVDGQGGYNGDYGDYEAIKCNDGCCEKLIHDVETPSDKAQGATINNACCSSTAGLLESLVNNASKSSDKREIRGCCKQFAEQCCGLTAENFIKP
nr:cadmium/zinc-transporting atpase hma2 [Quercus suber]